MVSSGGITALTNGAFVVCSPYAVNSMGQVSWNSGQPGLGLGYNNNYKTLGGSTVGDTVGSGGIVVLPGGNYLVLSPNWSYLGLGADAGAVTWGSGTAGASGTVFNSQSLYGSQGSQYVGSGGVVVLANGNYLVLSPSWNSGAGAVTWCNGKTGVKTEVSSLNSMTGGYGGIVPLPNGNYVIYHPGASAGTNANAGAVAFFSGTTTTTGSTTGGASLTGSLPNDQVGSGGITVLTNGIVVVCSPHWSNSVGAVTWCSPYRHTGAVSALNSLTGGNPGDALGNGGVTALPNGNYLVPSPYWDTATLTNAGAVTWGNGTTGVVSSANSLVGGTSYDRVGGYQTSYYYSAPPFGQHFIYFTVPAITVLPNGNYAVGSPYWSNGSQNAAGAVTWGNGLTGVTGPVTANNSLIGGTAGDNVGSAGCIALTNGDDLILSPKWNNGTLTNAGALSWANQPAALTGLITTNNSVTGGAANGGASLVYAYDYPREALVAGCPYGNSVVLLYNRITQIISFPAIAAQPSPTTITLKATSSAGLNVSYAVASGPATLNGNLLSLTGPGTVAVTAAQPGDAATLPAATVTNTFTVTARVIQFATNSSASSFSPAGFKFQSGGFTGHGNIIVYSSTNLQTWQPLDTNPPVTGTFQYTDTNANRHPWQYYRLSEQ